MSIDQPGTGARDRSSADLVREITELVPRLVRDEVALAKAELTEKGKHAGVGAGMFGVSGLVVFFGTATLIAAAVLGLAEAVPGWLAALIVAVVLFVIGGALALMGKSQVSRAVPPVPQEAVDSSREDVRVVKESARR
jgi:uncharacterized membrane protein YqjE